ncbi:MAG TPA: hypothetical protein ENJ95_06605 [Bacteroidetes bacterium]|nr:hypothetical protein [Bacteroidota bacterium]
MNLARYFFTAILVGTFVFSCQRPLNLGGDDSSAQADWKLIDTISERLILGLHATPFEWYAITENEFLRFGGDDELLEKRPLQSNFGVLGIPALSDNSFVRLTVDDDSKKVVEFHLARNPSQIIKIPVDSLLGTEDSFVDIEFLHGSLGAFSSDGTLFLLPTTVLPGRYHVMLLFEVLHNASHTEFASVKVVKRVALEDLSSDFANLKSIKFLNGNFYVTAQGGAWRIAPSGEPKNIFQQWMLDAFSWQGDLYATGVSSFDLHKSTDNGLTWERLNQNSELKYARTAGNYVFTQSARGLVPQQMQEDLLRANSIVLPAGAMPSDAIYYGVIFFAGHYYFSIGREVYKIEDIVVE